MQPIIDDQRLKPILDKVIASERLSFDDGVLLYTAGSAPDGFWSDLHGSIPLAIGGTYTPIVGNFIGSYTDDASTLPLSRCEIPSRRARSSRCTRS